MASHLAVPLTVTDRVLDGLADAVVAWVAPLRVVLTAAWRLRFVRVTVTLLLAVNAFLGVCALQHYGHDGWAMVLFAAGVLVPGFVKAWTELGKS